MLPNFSDWNLKGITFTAFLTTNELVVFKRFILRKLMIFFNQIVVFVDFLSIFFLISARKITFFISFLITSISFVFFKPALTFPQKLPQHFLFFPFPHIIERRRRAVIFVIEGAFLQTRKMGQFYCDLFWGLQTLRWWG